MLRNIFVLSIVAVGLLYALQSPFYGLVLYLWVAYFRPEEWVWDDLIRNLNLSFSVGIFLSAATVFSGQKLRFSLRVILLFLFLGYSLLSTLLSPHREYCLGFWTEFIKIIVISYLIIVLVTSRAQYRLTLLVIAYSLGFEAAKQGWVGLILHPGTKNMNHHPFLGDENGVALGMLMLVPFFVALAQTSRKAWERYLHRFMLVGCFYRALSTYSRGGFVAAGALAGYYVLRSRHRARSLVGMVVVASLVLPVMPDAFWDRMATITSSSQERDESARGRLHFWGVAIDMANANPIVGVGYNGFKASYDDYDTSVGAYEGMRAVHSSWLGVLSEMGYPGFFLFITMFFLALSTCRKIRKASRQDGSLNEPRTYATNLEASLIVFIIGGTFISYHTNEMLWHLIGLSAALQAITASEREAESVVTQTARAAATARQPWGVAPRPAAASSVSRFR